MKHFISILALTTGLILARCGSNNDHHSHGEGADHTHEAPAHQSTEGDRDAVRIGSAPHDDENEDHSHDENSDHSHDEEHSHGDSTHTHGHGSHRH